MIHEHYSAATIEIAPSPEDTQVLHLCTIVDRIDTDELVDLVINREVTLQEQGVLIHVTPRVPAAEMS